MANPESSAEVQARGILDRLLEIRRRRHWSQSDMAMYLGLTEEAYRALEKGRTIRLEWITTIRLLDILDNSGLTADWFFGRTPGKTSIPAKPESDPSAGEGKLHSALEQAASRIIINPFPPPPTPLPAPVEKVPKPRKKRGFGGGTGASFPGSAPVATPAPVPAPAPAPAPVAAPEAGVPVLELATVGRGAQADGSVNLPAGTGRLRVNPAVPAGAVGIRVAGLSLPANFATVGDVLICVPGQPQAGVPCLLVLKNRDALLCVCKPDAAGRLRVNPLSGDQSARTLGAGDVLAAYTVVRRVPRDQLPASLAR